MTALEASIELLKKSRALAISPIGTDADMLEFGKLALAHWPTIQHALEELNRRRIA